MRGAARAAALVALAASCRPAPIGEPIAVPVPVPVPEIRRGSGNRNGNGNGSETPAIPELPCARDADCAYDPATNRCVADPRANPQPPVVDQGIVCFCEASRCDTLRVLPVPCESDASCAVRADPRPHPIAADAAHPHEHGRPCRDFVFSTTCERTNICTMHRHACPRRP